MGFVRWTIFGVVIAWGCSSSTSNDTGSSADSGSDASLGGVGASGGSAGSGGSLGGTGGVSGAAAAGGSVAGAAGDGGSAGVGGTPDATADVVTDTSSNDAVTVDSSDAGSFDPCQLQGCVLWLRADLLVDVSFGKVEGWQDLSGNGYDVVTSAGYQPNFVSASAFNGHPVVEFNQQGFTYLHNTTANPVAAGAARTVVVVGGVTGGLGGSYLAFRRNGTISGYLHAHNGSTYFVHTDGIAFNHFVNPATEFSAIDAQRFVSVATSGHITSDWMRLRVNSVAKLVQPPAAPNIETGASGFTIGNREDISIPAGGWNGAMAELVVYDRILTTSEILMVEAYATNRYGL